MYIQKRDLFKLFFKNQVAAVQHSIVKPTTDKVSVQRDAIIEKVAKIIKAAAASKVNVICLQEAWSKSSSVIDITNFYM